MMHVKFGRTKLRGALAPDMCEQNLLVSKGGLEPHHARTVRRSALAPDMCVQNLLVSKGGLEPPRPHGRQSLKLVRLPISPLRRGVSDYR